MILTIQLVSNIAAIFITVYFIPGIEFTGVWWQLVLASLVIGIINFIQKPVLNLIFPSFIYATLAIFTIPVNLSLLILTTIFVSGLSITGFWPAFWSVVIISLTNYSVSTIMNYK